MSDYEIQKDASKVGDWLSQFKDQAFQGIDNTYKGLKQGMVQDPSKAKVTHPPATTADTAATLALCVGILIVVVLGFLYADKDSWLRRLIDGKLRRAAQ